MAQEGWIQEGVERTRVDQRLDGNRRLTEHEYVDQQGEIARDGVRKGDRKRKGASQPGPYWLGCPFFGREVSKAVWEDWGRGGGVLGSRDPGKSPGRLGRERLLVGTRLEGTRLEGTRMTGNRPGKQQQMQQQQQQQRWEQLLQLQQQQNTGGGEGGGAGRYPEPGGSERPACRWPACDQAGHNKRREQRQSGDDSPPW